MVIEFATSVVAKDYQVASDLEFARALADAKAGDCIFLAPGRYKGGRSRADLAGTKEAPMLIAGADPKNRPMIVGGTSGLHLRSPAHLEIRDLIFDGATGNGLNIDDGGMAEKPGHDLRLTNLLITNVGPRGNCDGLKLSGVDRFQIENCRFEKWGNSGSAIDMVGCHAGVVQSCSFTDATGQQANGVQTKGGSSEVTIRHCRFQNCGGRGVNAGGSTGADYFRPKAAAHEAKNITIEDCTFLGSDAAIAFVGVDGAIARHNTIYCPGRWAIRILQENTESRLAKCGNVRFENNLIAFRASEVSTAVNIGPNTAAKTFYFAGNVWSCIDRPGDAKRIVRTPSTEADGDYDFAARFKDAEKGDLSVLQPVSRHAGVR